MYKDIYLLWGFIDKKKKIALLSILALAFFCAVMEIFSIGSLIPFLSAIIKSDSYPNNTYGFNVSLNMELTVLIIVFIAINIFSGILRLVLLFYSNRVGYLLGSDLSTKIFKNNLYQEYSYYVEKNSSEIVSTITNKINDVVQGIIMPTIILITSSVMVLIVTVALLFADPYTSIFAITFFVSIYFLISKISRKKLKQNSFLITQKQTSLIRDVQEVVSGIRDVMIGRLQNIYLDQYAKTDVLLKTKQAQNIFYASSPRFILEALGISFIGLLAYYYSSQGVVSEKLPILAAMAFAAQRMLPILQNCYGSWASINGNLYSLKDILNNLNLSSPAHPFQVEYNNPKKYSCFNKFISFENVSFNHISSSRKIINNVNFAILKGQKIGIVGKTGSGKSTILDLLMGLLSPTEGAIKIDGINLNKIKPDWHDAISHVPQHIFLRDDSIVNNIALGVPESSIDLTTINHIIEMVDLSGLVINLPKGINEIVGERGVKLSGGQRQRIGIARALYKCSDVLILDEATSALDNFTEIKIINNIKLNNPGLTIISVAHRLSTIQDSDLIFEIDNGEITHIGKFNELLISSASFRKTVAHQEIRD